MQKSNILNLKCCAIADVNDGWGKFDSIFDFNTTVKSHSYVSQGFAEKLRMTHESISPDCTFFYLKKAKSSNYGQEEFFGVLKDVLAHHIFLQMGALS